MNFAYFRKSQRTYEETLSHLKQAIYNQGWLSIGEANLTEERGSLCFIYKQKWLDTLLEIDHRLLGMMPFSISVIKKEGEVLVGTGQTQILKALSVGEEMQQMASETELALKSLVHEAADVGPAKLEKVKLYSSMTCPYCKLEQNWLEKHQIDHKVVYVDLQADEAESLVQRTGQLGVPVTEIVFEESEPEFVIGFDQARLSQALNINNPTIIDV